MADRFTVRPWAVVVLASFIVLAVGCSERPKSGAAVRVSAPSAVTQRAEPADEASRRTESPSPRGTEAPSSGQVVTSVEELVRRFGWPPGTDFARLRIPLIGVDARVGARTVAGGGDMPNPIGPADVVWYDMSAFPGLGGAPGEGGNAIFSGHVDYDYVVPYADVRYRGKGVFAQLNALKNGDVIEIERSGVRLRYAVVWQKQLSASAEANWGDMWSSAVGKDSITLYTCAGRFDSNLLEYSDRLVVRAERI